MYVAVGLPVFICESKFWLIFSRLTYCRPHHLQPPLNLCIPDSPSAHIYDVGQWGCLKPFSSQVVNATYASQIKLAKNKTANNGIESMHRSSTLEVCTLHMPTFFGPSRCHSGKIRPVPAWHAEDEPAHRVCCLFYFRA